MNANLYIVVWVLLAAVVLTMAAWRLVIARRDDKSLHLVEDEKLIAEQIKANKTIRTIDRWGQSLTAAAIIYGLVLACVHLYHVWQASTKIQFR